MTTTDEKEQKKEATKARTEALKAKQTKANEGKSGVGLRTFFAMTRGKGTQEVSYEGFDDEKPETLPKDTDAFFSVVPAIWLQPEKTVELLIEGFNSLAYTNASDPIAEFVESYWLPEVQTRFKTIVRNYVKDTDDVSIEEAVALMKPAIDRAEKKRIAAESATV